MEGRLTTIAHNHDFGIDTMLVPGPPVRIHARIGGHRNGRVERRGRARKAQGGREGGEREEEEEEEEKEKEAERGKGTGAKRQAEGAATRDAIHHVAVHICGSGFQITTFCGF